MFSCEFLSYIDRMVGNIYCTHGWRFVRLMLRILRYAPTKDFDHQTDRRNHP